MVVFTRCSLCCCVTMVVTEVAELVAEKTCAFVAFVVTNLLLSVVAS